MKIDDLVKREDFYTILEHTLNHYYKDILHTDVTVRVDDKKFSNSVVVYPKLNRIIRRNPNSRIVKGVYSGFSINDNPVKRICAKLYITMLLYSAGMLSAKSMYFSDLSVFTPFHEICGGNKKIRINDQKQMTSDVIMKSGFEDDYFRNEMDFRLNNKADYLVPIIEYGDDWYREKLIDGCSLARVTDRSIYEASLEKAMEHLGDMIDKSKHYVKGEDYAKILQQEITVNIDKLFNIKKDVKFDRSAVEKQIEKLLKEVSTIEKIPVAVSHGDFQTGNIVVDKQGKVYLIDWETYKTRSIWYDAITAKLFIRRRGSWEHILENKMNPEIAEAVYSFDSGRECSVEQAVSVLLLEDLSFKLTDALMVPGELGCNCINITINEIMNVVKK